MRPWYAFPYIITENPSTMPLTLAEIKQHLRLDPVDTTDDNYLSILASIALLFCEKYTKRDIINKTYLTYRDVFGQLYTTSLQYGRYNQVTDESIELRRSKFQGIKSFQYLFDGILTDVDPLSYYNTDTNYFTRLYPDINNGYQWPPVIDDRAQAIQITFYAGYGIWIKSASRTLTTVTVETYLPHNFLTGDIVIIDGATGTNKAILNGTQTLTVIDNTHFTFTSSTSGSIASFPGTIFAYKIPISLLLGMKHHIARMYENRGDAPVETTDSSDEYPLPLEARVLYNAYRILELSV